jgi:hypothetical protein
MLKGGLCPDFIIRDGVSLGAHFAEIMVRPHPYSDKNEPSRLLELLLRGGVDMASGRGANALAVLRSTDPSGANRITAMMQGIELDRSVTQVQIGSSSRPPKGRI